MTAPRNRRELLERLATGESCHFLGMPARLHDAWDALATRAIGNGWSLQAQAEAELAALRARQSAEALPPGC